MNSEQQSYFNSGNIVVEAKLTFAIKRNGATERDTSPLSKDELVLVEARADEFLRALQDGEFDKAKTLRANGVFPASWELETNYSLNDLTTNAG